MASQPGEIGARDLAQLMAWYRAIGVDEAIGDSPVRDFSPPVRKAEAPAVASTAPPVQSIAESAAPPAARPKPAPALTGMIEASDEARRRAAAANSLEDLRAALDEFDGCPLKTTAMNTVFADGNPEASIMIVGEAPGGDEDRQGVPFVGASGQLMDRMFACIGLDRTKLYITNILPWRPPGNRQPTAAEIGACLPFCARHIELVRPKLLIMAGGTSAKTLLNVGQGIMKLRGSWYSYQTAGLAEPIPAFPIFHPAFLLRSAIQKRLAWRDLLTVKQWLAEHP